MVLANRIGQDILRKAGFQVLMRDARILLRANLVVRSFYVRTYVFILFSKNNKNGAANITNHLSTKYMLVN
jgi:hypothetical protein